MLKLFAKIESRSAILIAVLTLASVAFSFGFACAAPLAAIAAFGALRMERSRALALAVSVWLANQVVGYIFLSYPLDTETLAWGGALGLVAILSVEAAMRAKSRPAPAVLAFAAAFATYEGVLFAITVLSGSAMDAYEPAAVARVFAINAIAFAALLAVGKALRGANPVASLARPERAA